MLRAYAVCWLLIVGAAVVVVAAAWWEHRALLCGDALALRRNPAAAVMSPREAEAGVRRYCFTWVG